MYEINPSLKVKKNNNNFILVNKQYQRKATNEDLFILKIISEKLNPLEICNKFNFPVKLFFVLLENLVNENLIIKTTPLIIRDKEKYKLNLDEYQDYFLAPEVFTLQWHITNRCDLSCKHCYDRSNREDVSLERAYEIIDKFFNFCFNLSIFPQISFTGGNPFLCKNFIEIYKRAADYGITLGILGNPVSEEKLVEIITIQKPNFYQISIEGTEDYNDFIRGKGHFKRSMNFLKLLKKYNIHSNVMLTLNKDNINQVFSLIEMLNGICDTFTFNRLSLVGEGKNLKLFNVDEYKNFLEKYIEYAKEYRFLRLKDNLLNILLYKNDRIVTGGCTGFGCGAAFNFFSLLSNGEVHACRKFPSFIGNINQKDFEEIYFSEIAEKYRLGPIECKKCNINRVCRGCLAIINSFNLDVTLHKDPYCFL